MRTLRYLVLVAAIGSGAACSSSEGGGGQGGAGATGGGATGGSAGSGATGGSAGSGATGGSAGSGATGGSAGSGATGGSAGGGASGGTAGGAGAGGGGGTAPDYVCDAVGGTPGSCESSGQFDTCGNCIKAYCCSEREACLSTNPNDPCGYGGPSGFISEAQCFQKCFKTETGAGASVPQAHATCSTNCVSPGCTTISSRATALMSCLEAYCLSQCLS